jgi:hypothetical protein
LVQPLLVFRRIFSSRSPQIQRGEDSSHWEFEIELFDSGQYSYPMSWVKARRMQKQMLSDFVLFLLGKYGRLVGAPLFRERYSQIPFKFFPSDRRRMASGGGRLSGARKTNVRTQKDILTNQLLLCLLCRRTSQNIHPLCDSLSLTIYHECIYYCKYWESDGCGFGA